MIILVSVLFSLGIYLSDKISIESGIIFYILFTGVWTVISALKRKWDFSVIITVSALIFGMVYCGIYTDKDRYEYSICENHFVNITGRIAELPEKKDYGYRYVIEAGEISMGEEVFNEKVRLLVSSEEKFNYNDTVDAGGILKLIPESMNTNGFDSRMYYKSKNIFFKMYADEIKYSDRDIKSYTVYAFANTVRDKICRIIDIKYKGDSAAVLRAILTGDKSGFSNEYKKILNRTGMSRFFNPAFMHVMLITSVIGTLSTVVPKKYRVIVMSLILILYALCNSSNPMFLKTCIFAALFPAVKWFKGGTDAKSMLAATVFIIELSNPAVLFNCGFIMSVYSMILILNFKGKIKFKSIKSVSLNRYISNGIICTLGMIPITAYYFNGICIYSIAASVIMFPLTMAMLVASPIFIFMLAVFKKVFLSGYFMSFIIYIIMKIPILIDKMPFSHISLPTPGIVFTAAYIIMTMALYFKLEKERKKSFILLIISISFFLSTAIIQTKRINTAEISFVNVGQGDGAVINVPFEEKIIIDGGGGNEYSEYNPGESIFVPYLVSKGITKIEAAFVSHYHKDHIQGVIEAVKNLRVKTVFMPGVYPDNELRVELENACRENNTKIFYITSDMKITFDNGVVIDVTIPSKKTLLVSEDENDVSLVLNVNYYGFNAVFTGDMTSFAEKNLVFEGKIKKAELLKVAHHGSSSSTSNEWLKAVDPDYAVISLGEDNSYGFPKEDVLQRLKGVKILRTDSKGDITFILNKKGLKSIKAFKN